MRNILHCWLVSPRLSAYLDDEANAAERARIERHLGVCDSCRSAYESVKAARETLRALPRLLPRETFSVELQLEPSEAPQRFARRVGLRGLRWVLASLVVAGLAFTINLLLRQDQPSPLSVAHAYTLDMEMYLDGLSQDRSQLERFENLYESRSVSLDQAQAQAYVGFKINALLELPGGFSFVGAYLLKSGCCHAVRLRYHRPGAEVDLFQQPQGHPVTFGSKPTFIPAALPQCHSARSGAQQAYAWQGADKGLVVVSDLPEREVAAIVQALSQRGRNSTLTTSPAERR